MNKAQIKAELRRAAATDDPWLHVNGDAYSATWDFHESCISENKTTVSWFFLIVAEAL